MKSRKFSLKRMVLVSAMALTPAFLLSSSRAEASHPDVRYMYEIRELSQELAADASDALAYALDYASMSYNMEDEAIRNLKLLLDSALYFQQEVENYYGNPEMTENAFIRVSNDYYAAEETLGYLNAYGYARSIFDEIRVSIYRLRRFYDINSYYPGTYVGITYQPRIIHATYGYAYYPRIHFSFGDLHLYFYRTVRPVIFDHCATYYGYRRNHYRTIDPRPVLVGRRGRIMRLKPFGLPPILRPRIVPPSRPVIVGPSRPIVRPLPPQPRNHGGGIGSGPYRPHHPGNPGNHGGGYRRPGDEPRQPMGPRMRGNNERPRSQPANNGGPRPSSGRDRPRPRR
jgi:hypothetical protein